MIEVEAELKKWKIKDFEVVSAIYIKEKDKRTIVSLGCGNRCLNMKEVTKENCDLVIHDSHAEVMARRGFLQYARLILVGFFARLSSA